MNGVWKLFVQGPGGGDCLLLQMDQDRDLRVSVALGLTCRKDSQSVSLLYGCWNGYENGHPGNELSRREFSDGIDAPQHEAANELMVERYQSHQR